MFACITRGGLMRCWSFVRVAVVCRSSLPPHTLAFRSCPQPGTRKLTCSANAWPRSCCCQVTRRLWRKLLLLHASPQTGLDPSSGCFMHHHATCASNVLPNLYTRIPGGDARGQGGRTGATLVPMPAMGEGQQRVGVG